MTAPETAPMAADFSVREQAANIDTAAMASMIFFTNIPFC